MDGTLVDTSSVKHLVGESLRTQNFDALHAASIACPTIPWVVEAAREAKRMGFRVIQLTARQEQYRALSYQWMEMNDVPSDGLYMRANGDFRPDADVKRDVLKNIFPTHDIVKAFDDNPSIVELWKEFEVPCVVVPGWEG